MSKKLEELREKIDGIDEKIVKLYRERMDVTKDIAAYKKEKELPVLDAGRERAVLAKIGQLAGDDLADYAQSVYRTVMATTRSYQNFCNGVTSGTYDSIRATLDCVVPMRSATCACVSPASSRALAIAAATAFSAATSARACSR